MCAPSPPSRKSSARRARRHRGARRGLHGARRFRRAQRAPGRRRASRSSPIRATPPPARCASSTPRSPPSGRCKFFAYAWGEAQRAARRRRRTGAIDAFRALRPAGQSADAALPLGGGDARRIIAPSKRSARRSATTSTASSTRSTTSRCSSGSASSRARRAGRSRTSFPPSGRRRSSRRSRSRSAAPAR